MHPGEKFITYRANGAKRSSGRGNKKIETWIDHCFASNLLLKSKIIQNVGVYDIGKFRHGVRLAKSMHNMISIGIDYGRALNLVHPETNVNKKHEFEGRMRYIYSTEKRKEYAAIIDKNLRATECSRIMQEAEVMSGELKCMREKTGVHNNKCSDKKVSLVRVGSLYMDPVTGEVHKEDRWGMDEFEDKVEEKRRQLGEKLDDAMECVVGVVREERTRRLRVNTGNRRNG